LHQTPKAFPADSSGATQPEAALVRSFASARCLVLGGGGFLGINLSNALALAGAQVHAYGRSLSLAGSLVPSVRWTTADFADRQTLATAIESVDYVFHLVSSSTPSSANADPIADVNANLVATLGLLEICRVRPIKRLVFVSSGGTVYGVPQAVPISETAPTDPVSAYGIHKIAIEKYLALYHRLYQLDYVVLRVANPYGPMQLARKNQGVIAAFLQHALADEPIEIWGTGEVVRDFVYVDDVVRALTMAAVHQSASRVFNVGSGAGISLNTVLDSIEHVLDRGAVQRIYKSGRLTDVPVNVLDIRRIKDEMGWTPLIQWEDGLRRAASWMRRFEAGAAP
jgi:UDP-glucose 4-epimerase